MSQHYTQHADVTEADMTGAKCTSGRPLGALRVRYQRILEPGRVHKR